MNESEKYKIICLDIQVPPVNGIFWIKQRNVDKYSRAKYHPRVAALCSFLLFKSDVLLNCIGDKHLTHHYFKIESFAQPLRKGNRQLTSFPFLVIGKIRLT